MVTLGGCQTATLPDPNDPKDVGVMAPDEIRHNLSYASAFLGERSLRGEITDQQFHDLMAQRAQELGQSVDLNHISPDLAWEYGEIFITAREWKLAKSFLEIAVKKPVNEDRRVNDSLRLARVEAELGNVPRAVALARSTFNTVNYQKAPIMPAVLLEIVPAGQGKGSDVLLADLLVDCIPQIENTLVNPSTDSGHYFLLAKPRHIQHAYQKAIELYQSAGQDEKVSQVKQQLRQFEIEKRL
jgi:hypothetical protein